MIPDNVWEIIKYSVEHYADDGKGYGVEARFQDEFRVKDWYKSQPTMPQAPWEDAPEYMKWAFIAQTFDDETGMRKYKWIFCEVEPMRNVDDGSLRTVPHDRYLMADSVNLKLGIDIRTTLQRRPEATE